MRDLTLVSHVLCPYVQRAVIALTEKEVTFRRIDIDLSAKPAWFTAMSPLGKVPLLAVRAAGEEAVIFESAVILEYLEETAPHPLHPADPLARARHRGFIEFASAQLNGIARLYNAATEADLDGAAAVLRQGFARLEADLLSSGPYFAGERFSLVDAAFAPVFRYFDVFETRADLHLLGDLPKIADWRRALAARPSVRTAAVPDYHDRLAAFLAARPALLGRNVRPAA